MTRHRAGLRAGVALAAVVLAAGCTPGSNATTPGAAGVEPTGTVEFWHFFTDREAEAIDGVVADFEAKYPKVNVDRQGRPGRHQDDSRRSAPARAPTSACRYSTDIVGKFCATGAWLDLRPYIERDKVDLNQFPDTVRSYTEYQGKRCAMPFLADAYGLYYNKKLLRRRPASPAPPKTLDRARRRGQEAHQARTPTAPSRAPASCRCSASTRTPRRTSPRWSARSGSTPTARRRSAPTRPGRTLLTLAEGPRRLVRLRQPGEVPRRPRRRVVAPTTPSRRARSR